jgi:anhydro-N-acetylmuramic acid kinase
MQLNSYGIGLMSGTSLDGLDIAFCEFKFQQGYYSFRILKTEEIVYDQVWKDRLSNSINLSGKDLMILDKDFAQFCALQINSFLEDQEKKPEYIASHGQTIFHDPLEGYSTQIGSGAIIAALTGITTISNFRSTDVALGGQGAPLVPIGDHFLFSDYDACLNLGGISNISYLSNGKRIAYDISICNMALNYLSEKLNQPYDQDGKLAQSGTVIEDLLMEMNHFPFFKQSPPKSLGKEWFISNLQPLLESSKASVPDLLATMVEHISLKISEVLPKWGEILVTGGGALNSYLIQKIQSKTEAKIIIPDQQIIKFKEAIIFAFLGFLRLNHQINTLSDVTGAIKNSSGGAVYYMK